MQVSVYLYHFRSETHYPSMAKFYVQLVTTMTVSIGHDGYDKGYSQVTLLDIQYRLPRVEAFII